jgi:hypothetical protein
MPKTDLSRGNADELRRSVVEVFRHKGCTDVSCGDVDREVMAIMGQVDRPAGRAARPAGRRKHAQWSTRRWTR